jgi:thymidine phosphorylase
VSHHAVDVIRAKRDGGELSDEQIRWFIDGYTHGRVSPEQASALLMAVVWRGMSARELDAWTDAMIRSGSRLDLSAVPLPTVDKHSTGGVGDKVSLPLCPLVAACGAAVPQLSGRGLGHTGGTLDKLEAIPGFRVDLTPEAVVAQLQDVGAVICAAGEDLAPADRELYALRDVTGTVESIPLIASSIMSKKVAEGTAALVLDVKVGDGAFMTDLPRARELARTMVGIGEDNGVRTAALITDMDAPLGRAVGNANEVIESIETLKGRGPADVEELSVRLAARMLVLAGIAAGDRDAEARVRGALTSGAGVETFRRIVENQGGDPRAIDDYSRLPSAPDEQRISAERNGFVRSLHAERIGRAAVALGAGRATLEDTIDPGVGIEVAAPVGTAVNTGDTILLVRHRGGRGVGEAMPLLASSVEIGDEAEPRRPVVLDEIPGGSTRA